MLIIVVNSSNVCVFCFCTSSNKKLDLLEATCSIITEFQNIDRNLFNSQNMKCFYLV